MPTLLEKVSDISFLENAWKKLHKANLESHGSSNVTIADFKENLYERLESISKQLKTNKFKFSPNRAVAIQKSNGTFRPLQIPEISDRVVLKAIALELEDQFSSTIHASKGISFAYQKKLGIKDAIERVIEHYKEGYEIILEADIINFFGSVQKEKLLSEIIFPKLPDTSLNGLLESALNQTLSGLESLSSEMQKAFINFDKGIPQGNPLSPLLSNIFLAPFDQFAIQNNFKMVRYADDFVILCSSKVDAEKCFIACQSFLAERGLQLYDLTSKKSRIVEPKSEDFIFLSIQFDGEKIFPSKASVLRLKDNIRNVCNIKGVDLMTLFRKLKNRLDGWVSAYYYTKLEGCIEEIDFYIDRQIYLAISKLSWKLKNNSLAKVPYKYRHLGESSEAISRTQRLSSGVPLGSKLMIQKRKNKF